MTGSRPKPDSDAAASEVLGSVLTLGILALVLTGSTIAMLRLQEDARLRGVAAQADAVAVQVAAAFGHAAAFITAEAGHNPVRYERTLDLPRDFGGHGYTVRVDGAGGKVIVSANGMVAEEPLLGAAIFGTSVCGTVGGGPTRLVYGAAVAATTPCAASTLHLESP